MIKVKFETDSDEIDEIYLKKVTFQDYYKIVESNFCPQSGVKALKSGKWYSLYQMCWFSLNKILTNN